MAFYVYTADSTAIAAFDLLESETHMETCVATEHNVEEGSPVTDHVIIESSVLSLVLGVTNTPTSSDPDRGRGRVSPVELYTPTHQPPFDGTPGALFRAASASPSGIGPQSTFVNVLQFVPSFDRIAETEQVMLDIKNGAKLCSVTGLSRQYDDMIVERLEVARTKPGIASFSIDLKQIRFVRTASVQAPEPLEPRGTPISKKGQQAPKETPEGSSTTRKSDLLGIIDRIRNLGGG
jgi:hypothetical protein